MTRSFGLKEMESLRMYKLAVSFAKYTSVGRVCGGINTRLEMIVGRAHVARL